MRKVLDALKNDSQPRRRLARLTHLKVATIDLVIRSLKAQNKVRIVTVSNSHCEPSYWISLNTVTDAETEEKKKRQRRLIRMAALGS